MDHWFSRLNLNAITLEAKADLLSRLLSIVMTYVKSLFVHRFCADWKTKISALSFWAYKNRLNNRFALCIIVRLTVRIVNCIRSVTQKSMMHL